MMNTKEIIKKVEDTYKILSQQNDLSPRNQVINNTLSDFVTMSAANDCGQIAGNVLSHSIVSEVRPRLLPLLSEAESQMEYFFSKEFARKPVMTEDSLRDFWYLDNYIKLSEQDLSALRGVAHSKNVDIKNTHPVFIGSGALPLSAILLHKALNVPVTCLDCDPEAVRYSRRLISKLDLEESIMVRELCSLDYDYEQHEVVFIAAMVHDRLETLNKISSADHDAIICMRSVENLRCLLYEPLDVKEIESETDFRFRYFSKADEVTINSTYVFVKAHERRHSKEKQE